MFGSCATVFRYLLDSAGGLGPFSVVSDDREGGPVMLVELAVVEQRYRAVLEVLEGSSVSASPICCLVPGSHSRSAPSSPAEANR